MIHYPLPFSCFNFHCYNDYLREQIILPVLSKSYRFEESPILEYFSAPRSVLNPKDIIENRKVLLVNTRMSELGSDLSDFIGSFIISVILREISRQGENDPSARIPVEFLIDEFQTYSGVPWQELLAQFRKWGGRTVLGTQSFASMKTEDSRDLPGIIMSGVYSIFAFTVNGEDADYLSRNELSEKFGGPSRDTLISLDPYTCYARIMRRDDYARKKSEAVSEALRYLDRVVKYGFYSSGKMSSAGSDSGSLNKGGEKNNDIDTWINYPENKEIKSEDTKNDSKADPVSEEKMDSEKMKRMDKRYDGLFNL